jgi:nicotinate phosphoribosyltransferase
MRPAEQVQMKFIPEKDTNSDSDLGDIELSITGKWLETILYEIPLLALISETYFKFMNQDWTYAGQVDKAKRKGTELLENGCIVSEFGTRRRRDYHTQDLVLQGLRQAQEEASHNGWPGKLSGTSNVHFAMTHGLIPVGTVAHEWFMGIAAVTDDYEHANEIALQYWVATFGEGVLAIALTDTFGTSDFLKAFDKPISTSETARAGAAGATASPTAGLTTPTTASLRETQSPIDAQGQDLARPGKGQVTYAEAFTGVRQDSGDPREFMKVMREFYDRVGIKDKKSIVFSDSLNVELCLQYKKEAEALGFQPSFGVGTFLTSR